jgi:RHS repeat-associated protein
MRIRNKFGAFTASKQSPAPVWARFRAPFFVCLALFSTSAMAACPAGKDCVPMNIHPWCFPTSTYCNGEPSGSRCPERNQDGYHSRDEHLDWLAQSFVVCQGAASVSIVGPEADEVFYGSVGGLPITRAQEWRLRRHWSTGTHSDVIVGSGASRGMYCPAGFTGPDATGMCERQRVPCTVDNRLTDHPVVCGTQEKRLDATDLFAGNGLVLQRHYNSQSVFPSEAPHSMPFGAKWSSRWTSRLQFEDGAVRVLRARGDQYYFLSQEGQWIGRTGEAARLSAVADAQQGEAHWLLRNIDDSIEEFSDDGRLLAIAHLDGNRHILTYDEAMRLVSVTDRRGRTLSFHWGLSGRHERVMSVSFQDGASTDYHYDEDFGRLVGVTAADGSITTYLYAETEHSSLRGGDGPHMLTGIVNPDGVRHSVYKYDASGKVTESGLAGGAGKTTFTFGTNFVNILSARGVEQRIYSTVADARRVTRTNIRECHSCPVIATSTTTYDSNGFRDAVTDFGGVTTDFDHDSRGLELQRIEARKVGSNDHSPFRRTLRTVWHADFRLPTERRTLDAAGVSVEVATLVHNERGQIVATCAMDPLQSDTPSYACGQQNDPPEGIRQTRIAYCELSDTASPESNCPLLGLIKSQHGPRSDIADTTTYTYYTADAAGCETSPSTCAHRRGDLRTVTNALGHVSETLRYDGAGRPLSMRDANGVVTDLEYHPRGWLTRRIVRGAIAGADAITRIDYLPTGLVSRVTQPDGSFVRYEYDAAHRLIAVIDALDNRIDYTLDAAGNRTREQVRGSDGALVREQRRVYDTLGRLEQQLDAQGRATRHGYDLMGRPTSLIDPLDTESRNAYDPLGRLRRSIQDYHGIAADTQFDYDAQDRLLSVTDPNGLQTHYGYDGFGGLVSLSSPDTGVAEYRHDAAGNRIWQRDARGVETDYAYDALNRLIAIQYPDSTLNVAFHYDEPDIVTGCPASHPVGRLTRMLDATGSTTYCYDRRGNVVEKRQHTGMAQLRLRYTYDRADRLVELEYPSGQRVSLARDDVGRIRSAVLGSGGGSVATSIGEQKLLVTQVDYLPFGPASSYTFGNGATLTRSYDQDFRLTAVASPALSLAFEHDAAGNIRASGPAPDAWEEGYDYDGLYRLTGILAGKAATVGYTYDATGNRTSHQRPGEPPVPYAYPPDSHRLASVGDTVRSYDETGNTLDGIAFQATLSYGDHGRLQAWSQARGQHARYAYNGRGERITKTDPSGLCINVCPGTLFLYDEAGRLLGEYDLSGQPRQEHVWLDATPVAVLQGKSIHYVHSDHLNTPRAITDEKGIVRWRWAFAGNAFGEQPADGDPQREGKVFEYNLRFPGQYFDAESGLHYNYFRDYDPSTGRYIESDPIGLEGGLNTYSYAEGSPLLFVDPLGLAACSKGGKSNIGTEGFTKRSDAKDVEQALKDAMQKRQHERIKKLRGLLKVIKRGGSMGIVMDVPSGVFRELCLQGDSSACTSLCMIDPDNDLCTACSECEV